MSRKTRVLSDPAAAILQRFCDAPDDEMHGFAIIRATEIGSGTLYPALRLLADQRGFLTWRWEAIDPEREGRPPRRFYRLSADRERRREARDALAEHAERATRPLGGIPTPRTVGA